MSYTVTISHDDLIDLLQTYDNKVYENIKDGDLVTIVEVGYGDIEITIGEEEE